MESNQNTNPQGGNPDEIIKKQKQDMVKLAQIIKDLQLKNGTDFKTLKEENNSLKEEIKNMGKTTNDMMKHMAKGDISDLTYIQKQHDIELNTNKEIIKNLTETMKEKNEEIEKFSEEIIYLRGLLEEEKKKN
jgi:predicted RNase H-like nuclease (RuvC/YqgF family)